MTNKVFMEVELLLLPPEEGGRTTALSVEAYNGRYKPHIVLEARHNRQAKAEIQNGNRVCTDAYVSVAFWSGPFPFPVGQAFKMTLWLWAFPHAEAMYEECQEGATFTLREGAKIIGHGEIKGICLPAD